MSDEYLWNPTDGAPDRPTQQIETLFLPMRTAPPGLTQVRARARSLRLQRRWKLGAVSLGSLAAAAGVLWAVTIPSAWQAVALGGSVRIENREVTGQNRARIAAIQTGVNGRASINIGRVGEMQVGPNSHVTVDKSPGRTHRITLAYGRISARIAAAPRRVVVQTASTEVIDLGCVYSLSTDSAGNGMLAVQEGHVELHRHGVRVVVPAGYSAAFFAARAPGLPLSSTASPALRAIVRSINEERLTAASVEQLLAVADSTSAITLWYLLPRVSGAARGAVVSRLIQYATLPAGVSRDRILENDAPAMAAWQQALERRWKGAELSWWRREVMIRKIWATPAVSAPAP